MVCGPWWCDKLIPDKPFGLKFKAACAAHDACYIKRSKPRKDCDKDFLAAMLKAVKDSGKGWYWRWVAYAYYRAVRMFGWPSYHNWW